MIHENFIKKIEQESPEFNAIMNILSPINQNAEKGRKLLCLVNQILDFYVHRDFDSDEDVKMPIVYLPLCEEWAQFLCEEFVTLKMSLLWGEGMRTAMQTSYRSKPYIYIPENSTKKEREALSKQFAFKKLVAKHITKDILSFPSQDNEKCFIYCRSISDEFRLTSKTKGHYHFSYDVMGDKFSTEKSMILLGENEKELYEAIENNDGVIKIPNVILFLQKDMDGRNTPLCMQMQRSTINEYNEDYDTGIKNVISFAFSQKPYKLQRIYENKHNLVERLQREKISETRDFISFTKEEMDFVFGRKEACIEFFEIGLDEGSEQQQIKAAFDFMLQDMQHEVKLRNELAICFTEQSHEIILNKIFEQNPEVNEEYTKYYLQLIKKHYEDQLFEVLINWCLNHQIGVVLDYNVDPYIKKQLEIFLKEKCGATMISFYTFKNFKIHKDGSRFYNSIKENKILVLSMLNHCTGHNWAIYPNSFDQYYLNSEQNVLQINNRIVFDPRFSWYQYRYVEEQKLLLNSSYRTKYVKNGIVLPPKPMNLGAEPKDDEDEQDSRNRCSFGREQNKVIISFGSKQHRILDEDDLILCKYLNEVSICSISDIVRDFDDPTVLEIQPLIDFYQPIETLIDNEERKTGDGETIIRNNPKYGLAYEEKVSNREMWKILLEHRVAIEGEQAVFNSIMKPLVPAERIQFGSFQRWLDISENSILPRSRRMQKRVIEEYLQIENLYTRMLRHRKSRTSTNTEGKNSILKSFLIHCFLESDTQKAYKGLSHEIRDYLNISDGSDIKVIIELIKGECLNLRKITKIKYE